MKFAVNTFFFPRRFLRLAASCVLFALCGPVLWAGGRKDQIETITAEGGEVWENTFDVTGRKKGLYNFIVYARDRAGNEAVSGAYNVKVDPDGGLSTARVVYPNNNAVIRQSINILGVASGRYGVSKVMARLDDGEYKAVAGTEYWNQFIDFTSFPDGKHTLYVQATDSKGVTGPEQSISFILDKAPPEIELKSHKVGDIISGLTVLKGTVTDSNGVKKIEYSEDGVKFNVLSDKKRGSAALDFSLPINSKRVPDGPLVYYLRATDTTGAAAMKPYLFFVSNSGPELEIYTPQGEDVYGAFLLSGRAYGTIGLSQLYYEWGKEKENIRMRSGDPYWAVPLDTKANSAASIKVTAVDKAGNTASVTCKVEDRRKVKVPVLVIDYPPEDALKAMQKNMPPDTAIYGYIAAAGSAPRSVVVEGYGEVEALSAFRIDPSMILPGTKAQNLKITPVADGDAKGAPVTLRYFKQETLIRDESRVTIMSPVKNSWLSGSSFTLQGSVSGSNMRLEYRVNPQDDWRQLGLDSGGGFASEIGMSGRPHGPVHLELRTTRSGEEYYPVYHPFNWSVSQPEIAFVSPPSNHSLVFGSKTVIGSIEHPVPIQRASYSLDRENFTDIPLLSRYGKAWFSYFCDFAELRETGGQLVFRFADAGGTAFDCFPDYTFEPNPPVPSIIVNTPVDQEVIAEPFDISGLAYYDVNIYGVYWRILGPSLESITPGPSGDNARVFAKAFLENPDVPFRELLTEQNFRIPVDFSMVTDGEYTVEIYAADIYGMRSETVSRVIKVSTEPPATEITAPVITRYNHKAIIVKGFSTDANGVAGVSISMDNGNTSQNVELYADGSWELALNTAAYTDGIYSALIRTIDNYGVYTLSNAMINIDNTPPELFLASPADGQHVGTNMQVMGRVSDNIALKSLSFQVISAENPEFRKLIETDPKLLIFETLNFTGFPQGEYIVRVVAVDLADNETQVSRKIVYDADDEAAEIAIFNPLPGEIHSGPVHVVGTVSGVFLPEHVRLTMNGALLGLVPVDRYGVFRYEIPESMLNTEGVYTISAAYNSETNIEISSPEHIMHYSAHGPVLQINSHQDGDVVTGRPWLSGQAWFSIPEPDEGTFTPREWARQRAENKVRHVMVSYDNGRTFKPTEGGQEWKFHLETSELPPGPQPVLVRARFANGQEAVRRLMLNVDTAPPQVETLSPPEDSTHRDSVNIYGTAGDNAELANVDISLRPGDKLFYSVPAAMQGLYFDVKALGATYFDVGLGLSLFDDNVRFQFQYGLAPDDGKASGMEAGGRYVGHVFGIKLLANIFYFPFDYLFGLDWAFLSVNFAIGANFSYFTMDDWRDPLFMGAIIGQLDIVNVNLQYIYPNWKYFKNYALYLEPELWFASSDVNAEIIPRLTFGLRMNWF